MATTINGSDNFSTADNASQTELNERGVCFFATLPSHLSTNYQPVPLSMTFDKFNGWDSGTNIYTVQKSGYYKSTVNYLQYNTSAVNAYTQLAWGDGSNTWYCFTEAPKSALTETSVSNSMVKYITAGSTIRLRSIGFDSTHTAYQGDWTNVTMEYMGA